MTEGITTLKLCILLLILICMSYLVQKGIGEFLNENHSVNSQIHDDECESSKFRTIARNHQLFLSQLHVLICTSYTWCHYNGGWTTTTQAGARHWTAIKDNNHANARHGVGASIEMLLSHWYKKTILEAISVQTVIGLGKRQDKSTVKYNQGMQNVCICKGTLLN